MTPKTRVRQLAPALFVAALALALGACSAYPNSTFNHHTDFNTATDALWDKLLFWGTLVFIFVEAILIFTIVKFRKREGGPPIQMSHGNTVLEIAWTVIPVVILIIIAIPTVSTIFKTEAPAPAGALEIEVTGHQWWWEYHYPQYGFSTANEFYLPKGRAVNFTLQSADVLHSFWVPQMGGKRDLITNHINHIWYTPNADVETMVWNGFCTEYCGTSHANMRIRAYTVPTEDFESWAAGQKLPAAFGAVPPAGSPASKTGAMASANGSMTTAAAGDVVTQGTTKAPQGKAAAPGNAAAQQVAVMPPALLAYVYPADKLPESAVPHTPIPAGIDFDDALLASGNAQRGRDFFAANLPKSNCVNCHTLDGIPGATKLEGPNLTHLASRHTIAAGLYPNDARHLARWIKNAPKMKPGAKMNTWGVGLYDPVSKKWMGDKGTFGAMTDQQIADVVAFLQTLK